MPSQCRQQPQREGKTVYVPYAETEGDEFTPTQEDAQGSAAAADSLTYWRPFQEAMLHYGLESNEY